MNQDPLSLVGKGYVGLSRFLNHTGDFSSFSFYDSIHNAFFPKALGIDPPTVTHGKKPIYLNSCGHSFKAATLTETPVCTSHLGQKKRRNSYVIKKSTLFFLAKYFFWLCKWSVFRVHQNAFQKEKSYFFISRYLLCLIDENIFLHTLGILDIYQFFSFLMFLTIILLLHIDSVR